MSDDKEFPQDFELATLLFKEQPIASQEKAPFESFEARFQSFVDQISSYLYSSVKDKFFTHFFLGIFSTLLDSELNDKLNIKNILYELDGEGNLKVAVRLGKDRIEKSRFFVFSEKIKKNTDEASLFTQGDLKKIEWVDDIPEDQKKNFTLININKDIRDTQKLNSGSTLKIKVDSPKDINFGEKNKYSKYTYKFKEITSKMVSKSKLEDYIKKICYRTEDEDKYKKEVKDSFDEIMSHIKNIFDDLGLSNKSEAEHHGFVAGIFNNFRYRYNARIYLEQFAGRGYADIILLVRGPKREICSIPILIELKAGLSGNEVTAESALKQAERYAYGCQLKKMRLVTSAEDILCVGLNLDFPDAFKTNLVSIQQQELFPVIENILNLIYEQDDPGYIEKKIKELVSKEYLSLPPTSEKSDAHYLGLFFLGQSLLLDRVLGSGIKKHVFVKKHEAELTRASRKKTIKEILFSDKSSLVSMIFMPSIDYKKFVLLNIIFIHKDEDKDTAKDLGSAIKINIPIDFYHNSLKDQKIVDVKLTFDLRKKQNNKTPTKTFLFTSVETFKSYSDYNSREIKNFNGQPKALNPENKLIELFNKTLRSQKYTENALKFSDKLLSSYEDLLNKIGYLVFPFKLLIKKEAHFQAVLHGLFDYYSDIKLKEGVRELVLTEFQIGAGERIDMMIQIIGVSKDNINKYKEYIPVGLELKYTTGNFSEVQKNELKKQMSRYVSGKAIKSITDGRKIAVIGVVFCNNPPNEHSLILTYKGDETVETLSTRSSIMLLPCPDGVDALTQNLASNIDSQPSASGGGKSGTEPNTSWVAGLTHQKPAL